MNEGLFSWWIYSENPQRLHDDLPLQASCPVLKIYETISISDGPKEIHSYDDKRGVLQLRLPFLQLFDLQQQKTIAFLRCGTNIHFFLRGP